MFSSIAIIVRDPLLRLVTASLFLVGVTISSVMPFASLVALDYIGLTDAAYSAILTVSSIATVTAALIVGIVSDQRANRRQLLVVCFPIAAVGFGIVWLTGSPVAFALAHMALAPFALSAFGQLFAIGRMAARRYGVDKADQIMATVRAAFSLAFVITPPLWSVAFAADYALIGVYLSASIATGIGFALAAFFWPSASFAALDDRRSGLRFGAALKEIGNPAVVVRMLVIGTITGSNQLYMVLFGLLVVKEIGGSTADVGRFHGLIALLEIPFMLSCGYVLRHMSKSGLIAIGGMVYAGFMLLFASAGSMAQTWPLVVPAALGAGIILSISISYLQDLMESRPGAGASLMAISNFAGQMIAALTFAIGTAVTSYAGTAVLGALLAITGSCILLAMDGWRKRAVAGV